MFKQYDHAIYTFTRSKIEEEVVIDEALDDGEYGVRFLGSDHVFKATEDQLSSMPAITE